MILILFQTLREIPAMYAVKYLGIFHGGGPANFPNTFKWGGSATEYIKCLDINYGASQGRRSGPHVSPVNTTLKACVEFR